MKTIKIGGSKKFQGSFNFWFRFIWEIFRKGAIMELEQKPNSCDVQEFGRKAKKIWQY